MERDERGKEKPANNAKCKMAQQHCPSYAQERAHDAKVTLDTLLYYFLIVRYIIVDLNEVKIYIYRGPNLCNGCRGGRVV